MIFDTNKEKGNAGLAMAVAWFASNGFTVSIPLNDTQDYDLVVEKDGKLKRVQCKSTNRKTTDGSFELNLKSCGGSKRIMYKTFTDTEVELLFCLTGDGTMYIFPREIITQKTSLCLRTDINKSHNGQIETCQYIVNF